MLQWYIRVRNVTWNELSLGTLQEGRERERNAIGPPQVEPDVNFETSLTRAHLRRFEWILRREMDVKEENATFIHRP